MNGWYSSNGTLHLRRLPKAIIELNARDLPVFRNLAGYATPIQNLLDHANLINRVGAP